MSQLSCSFVHSCADGINEHLSDVNVSQSCVVSEKKLILARVGLFEDDDGRDFTIRPQTSRSPWSKIPTIKKMPASSSRQSKGQR